MKHFITICCLSLCLISCEVDPTPPVTEEVVTIDGVEVKRNPNKNLYWGDTHLHTILSPDAFSQGNRLDPDQAFRFAKGEKVTSSMGVDFQLTRPLDFLVIADHAEGLGIGPEILSGNETLMRSRLMRRWRQMFIEGGDEARRAGKEMPVALDRGEIDTSVANPRVMGRLMMNVWRQYLPVAEKHNTPGEFTALLGYEWTSMAGGNNLHRVVVFRDDADRVGKYLPFSSFQSTDPEDLWAFLAKYEGETGGRALAIPHNGNLSNGRMFALADYHDNPMTKEYALKRSKWEPLIEATQIKGDGESHPYLSPNDEFAGYGVEGWDLGNMTLSELKTPDMLDKEYARGALKNGLLKEEELGVNPFKFGMIGSTDSHTGMATSNEDNWTGKFALQESDGERALSRMHFFEGDVARFDWQYLASGYAAVWAESNTRADLWDAMSRKEVYGTTGPRFQLRFFGGWEYDTGDADRADYVTHAYDHGVPMGGDLYDGPAGRAPRFIITAARDPEGANLDRIQIVKGWLEDGATMEKVYDVAWSGDRSIDSDGRLPAVGSTVDAQTATYSNDIGAPTLSTVWEDPDFDADQRAFYYVRLLAIPTPRWSTYDAARHDFDLPADMPVSIQERAYSSPIWYTP